MVDPPSISDHGPVSCILPFALPGPPVFTTRLVRGWRKLDRDQFRAALSSSFLCQEDDFYTGIDAASLFRLYEDTLRDLLDSSCPVTVSNRDLTLPLFGSMRNVGPWNVTSAVLSVATVNRGRRPTDWPGLLPFERNITSSWPRRTSTGSTRLQNRDRTRWSSVSTVLGKPSSSFSTPPFGPSEFLSFLSSKMETIRSATSDSPPPVFHANWLQSFGLCHPDDVPRIIRASPAKGCDLDPAPAFLIKEYFDVMLPFLTRLCNASIQSGCLQIPRRELWSRRVSRSLVWIQLQFKITDRFQIFLLC